MGKKFTAAQQNLCSVITGNLDEEHKEKISWIADIIGSLKTADADRLARTVQLAIEDNIKLHGGNIESAQTQDALAMVLTFLFIFDNTTSAYWTKTNERRALRDEYASLFIEEWLKQGVVEKFFTYTQIAQNPVTNALAALPRNAVQLMLDSPDGFATVGKGKSRIDFTFKEAAANGALKTQDNMLLDALLIEFQKTKQQMTALPIEEYLRMRGREVTASNKKEIRAEVLASLDRLQSMGFSYNEKVRGKYYPRGNARLNGGTAFIRNGVIYWNWNQSFMESLKQLPPMDYARETLLADPRTNVYHLSRYLDTHWRFNEGKKNEHTISVPKLLEVARNLPKIEEVKAQRGSPKQKIIDRFFRDLDEIDRLLYRVIDKDGNEVEPADITDYETFTSCKIEFETDAPRHAERVAARKKRERKNKDK